MSKARQEEMMSSPPQLLRVVVAVDDTAEPPGPKNEVVFASGFRLAAKRVVGYRSRKTRRLLCSRRRSGRCDFPCGPRQRQADLALKYSVWYGVEDLGRSRICRSRLLSLPALRPGCRKSMVMLSLKSYAWATGILVGNEQTHNATNTFHDVVHPNHPP